jgi:hypothetical protein
LQILAWRCELVWRRAASTISVIPVYAAPAPAGAAPFDSLRRGRRTPGVPVPQYFICQWDAGVRYDADASPGVPRAWNTWWALTQGDDNGFGYVPEVYFHGGDDGMGDAALRICTEADKALAGTRPSR